MIDLNLPFILNTPPIFIRQTQLTVALEGVLSSLKKILMSHLLCVLA